MRMSRLIWIYAVWHSVFFNFTYKVFLNDNLLKYKKKQTTNFVWNLAPKELKLQIMSRQWKCINEPAHEKRTLTVSDLWFFKCTFTVPYLGYREIKLPYVKKKKGYVLTTKNSPNPNAKAGCIAPTITLKIQPMITRYHSGAFKPRILIKEKCGNTSSASFFLSSSYTTKKHDTMFEHNVITKTRLFARRF